MTEQTDPLTDLIAAHAREAAMAARADLAAAPHDTRPGKDLT